MHIDVNTSESDFTLIWGKTVSHPERRNCIIMSFKFKCYYGCQITQRNTFVHVICMGQMRNAYKTLMENLKERDHLEAL
jgi:hypothetical protein